MWWCISIPKKKPKPVHYMFYISFRADTIFFKNILYYQENKTLISSYDHFHFKWSDLVDNFGIMLLQ